MATNNVAVADSLAVSGQQAGAPLVVPADAGAAPPPPPPPPGPSSAGVGERRTAAASPGTTGTTSAPPAPSSSPWVTRSISWEERIYGDASATASATKLLSTQRRLCKTVETWLEYHRRALQQRIRRGVSGDAATTGDASASPPGPVAAAPPPAPPAPAGPSLLSSESSTIDASTASGFQASRFLPAGTLEVPSHATDAPLLQFRPELAAPSERALHFDIGCRRRRFTLRYTLQYRRGRPRQLYVETGDPELEAFAHAMNGWLFEHGHTSYDETIASCLSEVASTYERVRGEQERREKFELMHARRGISGGSAAAGAGGDGGTSAGAAAGSAGSTSQGGPTPGGGAAPAPRRTGFSRVVTKPAFRAVWPVTPGDRARADAEAARASNAKTAILHQLRSVWDAVKADASCGYDVDTPDNPFYWTVRLSHFPADSPLAKGLAAYAAAHGQPAQVVLALKFPGDYPVSPPIVRVKRPIFVDHTAGVKNGVLLMPELYGGMWDGTKHSLPTLLSKIRAHLLQHKAEVNPRTAARYPVEAWSVSYTRVVGQWGGPLSLSSTGGARMELRAFPQSYCRTPEFKRAHPEFHMPDGMRSGNKVLLPSAIHTMIASVARQRGIDAFSQSARAFELTPVDARYGTTMWHGVLQFNAPEGMVVLPERMFEASMLDIGQRVNVKATELPKVNKLVLTPHSARTFETLDCFTVLEMALKQYATLTLGEEVTVDVFGEEHTFTVTAMKPADVPACSVLTGDTVDIPFEFRPPRDTEAEDKAADAGAGGGGGEGKDTAASGAAVAASGAGAAAGGGADAGAGGAAGHAMTTDTAAALPKRVTVDAAGFDASAGPAVMLRVALLNGREVRIKCNESTRTRAVFDVVTAHTGSLQRSTSGRGDEASGGDGVEWRLRRAAAVGSHGGGGSDGAAAAADWVVCSDDVTVVQAGLKRASLVQCLTRGVQPRDFAPSGSAAGVAAATADAASSSPAGVPAAAPRGPSVGEYDGSASDAGQVTVRPFKPGPERAETVLLVNASTTVAQVYRWVDAHLPAHGLGSRLVVAGRAGSAAQLNRGDADTTLGSIRAVGRVLEQQVEPATECAVAQRKAAADARWPCGVCTFLNARGASQCVVCGTGTRPAGHADRARPAVFRNAVWDRDCDGPVASHIVNWASFGLCRAHRCRWLDALESPDAGGVGDDDDAAISVPYVLETLDSDFA